MPKNKVSDPITDQEIIFARLVLTGTMTDRQAAEAAGLNPDSAAYTKSKPHVRAFMLEHRAAVQQELVQQDAKEQCRLNLDREQVLDRLWELAKLSPEMTRGSITGQVKALSMIIAMENFIPNRRTVDRPAIDHLAISSEKNSPPAPAAKAPTAAWLARHQPKTPHPSPAQQKDSPAVPAPGSPAEAPPNPVSSHSSVANPSSPSQPPLRVPYAPLFGSVLDLGVGSSIKINPFVHPR